MERILRKSSQIVELARHIAQNGLSTIPILVSKDDKDNWVVRDGNRRIAALKLLLNPNLCQKEGLRQQFRNISETYKDKIPLAVDCLACDNEQTMVAEILLRHSGTQSGVGQLTWDTYPRTAFMMQHNRSDPNRRVGQLLLWAEQQGIDIDDDFPVTSLTRFLSTDNLARLGFDVTADEFSLRLDEKSCIKVAQKIVTDFGTLKKNVNTVFNQGQQDAYISEIERECGIVDPATNDAGAAKADADGTKNDGNGTGAGANDGNGSGGTRKTTGGAGGGPSGNAGAGTTGDGGKGNHAGGRGSKPKANWDRPKLFARGIYPGKIDDDHWKVRGVISDLRQLKTESTTLAVAVLLRVLIEMSVFHYLESIGHQPEKKLQRDLGSAVRHMCGAGVISELERDVILSHARTENDLLSIETLQRFVHKPEYHPDRQTLHTLWDHICPFVVACWA
ncbi:MULTISPECIES: ParB/Srx family N-terminal domain-containing protein [unclassified Achromobacter]|uniref:ParB/Srx family N-terminal domain-containing protein n=1 Tax=unclassified Achromobacter TaxID=2626865 RepID=UPI00130321A3|nr:MULTISPECIES: ParB/Srx family N-terminal domain-containing protein [unclassified Achromobacter]